MRIRLKSWRYGGVEGETSVGIPDYREGELEKWGGGNGTKAGG